MILVDFGENRKREREAVGLNFELEKKNILKSQAEERDAWSPNSTGAMQVGQVKDLKIVRREKRPWGTGSTNRQHIWRGKSACRASNG